MCTHKAPTTTPAQRKINVSFIFRKILYTCVFAEKLKYTNEVVSLSAATIAKELKTYCDQTGAENM